MNVILILLPIWPGSPAIYVTSLTDYGHRTSNLSWYRYYHTVCIGAERTHDSELTVENCYLDGSVTLTGTFDFDRLFNGMLKSCSSSSYSNDSSSGSAGSFSLLNSGIFYSTYVIGINSGSFTCLYSRSFTCLYSRYFFLGGSGCSILTSPHSLACCLYYGISSSLCSTVYSSIKFSLIGSSTVVSTGSLYSS